MTIHIYFIATSKAAGEPKGDGGVVVRGWMLTNYDRERYAASTTSSSRMKAAKQRKFVANSFTYVGMVIIMDLAGYFFKCCLAT